MLTSEQLAHYREKGYVFLGQVASDAEFDALRERTDDITQGRVRYDGMMFQADIGGNEYRLAPGGAFAGPSDNYRKIEGWERDPVFLAYMQHPFFRGITRQFIGENVSIFRAMFMNKPPQKGTYLPYHQDGGDGWRLSDNDGSKYVTIWTALDDATVANGCVQVVPGTHKLGLLSKQGHVISAEHERQYAPDEKADYLELKAGEVVVLHNHLLHRSGVNGTNRSRRGFSVCYMDAAIHRTTDERGFPIVFGGDALRVEGGRVVGAF